MVSAGTSPSRARRAAAIVLATATLLACLGGAVSAQEPMAAESSAQDDSRTQLPAFLVDSYVAVSLGTIQYDFSQAQLEPGFRAGTVERPPVAARVVLFGHRFNRYLSAQLTYLRPVLYVSYTDVNGDARRHRLFTHFGGLTLKPELPVTSRVSIHGEIGLGVTSRRALSIDGATVVKEAHYPSVLVGSGMDYHLSPEWDLTADATYSPARGADRQPSTILWSGGMRYTMHALPPERVQANRESGVIFPEHVVQIEYTTGVGYGVNNLVSRKVPIFWGGNVRVATGLAVHYERNVFHTRRVFALDLGASASFWRSRGEADTFATLSMYPLLRFTVLRTRPADLYVCYSFAGPTYLSRNVIDGQDTGNGFTFQDFMGIGAFVGKDRHLSVGLKINHYSNGNIFTRNAGVKVPLTVNVGYAFR